MKHKQIAGDLHISIRNSLLEEYLELTEHGDQGIDTVVGNLFDLFLRLKKSIKLADEKG